MEVVVQSGGEAYSNFVNSVDSEKTRLDYIKTFKYFLSFVGVNLADCEQLIKQDQQQLERQIRNYIVYLRQEKKLAPYTVSSYITSVVHFFQMNGRNSRSLKQNKEEWLKTVHTPANR